MKIIKTASGKQIKISKSEWESIGKTAGWIKTAKKYDVEYLPSMFSNEKLTKTIRIDDYELEGRSKSDVILEKVQRGIILSRGEMSLQEAKDAAAKIVIEKVLPHGARSQKKGPSQKDLQRLRGIEMRKEQDKNRRTRDARKQLIEMGVERGYVNSLGLKDATELLKTIMANQPENIMKEMEQVDEDVNLVDALKSHQKTEDKPVDMGDELIEELKRLKQKDQQAA